MSTLMNNTSSYVVSVDSRGRPSGQPDNDYDIELGRVERVHTIQLAAAHVPESRQLFRRSDKFLCSSGHVTIPPLALLTITETLGDGSPPHTCTLRLPPTLNRATAREDGTPGITTTFPHFRDDVSWGHLVGSAVGLGEPLPLDVYSNTEPAHDDPYDLELQNLPGDGIFHPEEVSLQGSVSYCSYVEHGGLRLEHLFERLMTQIRALPSSPPPVLNDAVFMYSSDIECGEISTNETRLVVRLPIINLNKDPIMRTGEYVRIVEDDGSDFVGQSGAHYSAKERAVTFCHRTNGFEYYIVEDFGDEEPSLLHDVAGCPDHGGETQNSHRYALQRQQWLRGRLTLEPTYEGIVAQCSVAGIRSRSEERAYRCVVGRAIPTVWLADSWRGRDHRRFHRSSANEETVHGVFTRNILGIGSSGLELRTDGSGTIRWARGALVRSVSIGPGSKPLEQDDESIVADLVAGLHPYDFVAAARATGGFLNNDGERTLTLVDVHGVSHATIIPLRRFDQFSFAAFLRDAFRDRCDVEDKGNEGLVFRSPEAHPGSTIELRCGSRALARMLRLPVCRRAEVHRSDVTMETYTLLGERAAAAWQRTELAARLTVSVHKSRRRLEITSDNIVASVADVRVGGATASHVESNGAYRSQATLEVVEAGSGRYVNHGVYHCAREEQRPHMADPVVRVSTDATTGSVESVVVLQPGFIRENDQFHIYLEGVALENMALVRVASTNGASVSPLVPALVLRSRDDEIALEGVMRSSTEFAPDWSGASGFTRWPSNVPDAHCDVVQFTSGETATLPVLRSEHNATEGTLEMTVVDPLSLRPVPHLDNFVRINSRVRVVGPNGVDTDQYVVHGVSGKTVTIETRSMGLHMSPNRIVSSSEKSGIVTVVTDGPHGLRSTAGARVVVGTASGGVTCIVYSVEDARTVRLVPHQPLTNPTALYAWLVEVVSRSAYGVVCGVSEQVPRSSVHTRPDGGDPVDVTIVEVDPVTAGVTKVYVDEAQHTAGDRLLLHRAGDSRATIEWKGASWVVVTAGSGYTALAVVKGIPSAHVVHEPWHHGVCVAPTAGMLHRTMVSDLSDHLRTGQLPLPHVAWAEVGGSERHFTAAPGEKLTENALLRRTSMSSWERVTSLDSWRVHIDADTGGAPLADESRALRGDRWFSASASSTTSPTPHPLRPVKMVLRSSVPTLLFENHVGSRLGFPIGMTPAETDQQIVAPHVLQLAPPDYILMTLEHGGAGGDALHTHNWRGDVRNIFAKLYTGPSHLTLTANVAHRRYVFNQDVSRLRVRFFNPDWSPCDFQGRPHSLSLILQTHAGSVSNALMR